MPERVKRLIRDIPDFPKPGIVFKDITPVFQDPTGLTASLELMAEATRNVEFDVIAGIESRGFFFAPTLGSGPGSGVRPHPQTGEAPSHHDRPVLHQRVR